MLQPAGVAIFLAIAIVEYAQSSPSELATSSDTNRSVKSVGDLIAAGGKRLSVVEVKTLVTGSTAQGRAAGSLNRLKTVFDTDGSLKAELQTARGPIHLEGTWAVNDQGQLCTSFTKPLPSTGCAYVYSIDDVYFTAPKDESSAELLERRFTR